MRVDFYSMDFLSGILDLCDVRFERCGQGEFLSFSRMFLRTSSCIFSIMRMFNSIKSLTT